ncbi:MAG: histidine ammonia-lyase [Nanoarchaeota archaeon]|nr:histidine ammonia-lyase [Nanoarchaeota archaeon]MCG2718121.1 histidine ammonia-lyase [Nanoarchaeota archaeon]
MGVLKKKLDLEDFISYSTSNKHIKLSKKQEQAVKESEKRVEGIVRKGHPVYGINTGFGALCQKSINKTDIQRLQSNLIKSHACGVGDYLSKEETKSTMLLLINSLSKGYSGIRLSTLETLINMYNKDVLPAIPEKGSLGASGDLIPLAHLALVLIGEGEAYYKDKLMSGGNAMKSAGIKPVKLEAKEGLALINGTHAITAISSLNTYYATQLSRTTDIISAVSFEALEGIPDCLDPRIHNLKPHPGQKTTAYNIAKIIKGGNSAKKRKCCSSKVQDAYSIRCIPQVHGPVKDELDHIRRIIEIELNSITDNPLIFQNGSLSGGNFHGQYIAIAMDNFSSTITALASISERRIDRLMNHHKPFLISEPGLNSGLMIPQYLAAALLSENKVLVYPATNTSVPVSGNQEDYVSMAMTSALKARTVLKNAEYISAVELLCGTQGLEDCRKKGKGVQKAYDIVRTHVKPLKEDRILYKDIEKLYGLVHDGILLKEVENEIGLLR